MIMRIFNTTGHECGQTMAFPAVCHSTFLRQAQSKPLTVFGEGSQTRSCCYVEDLIRGMIAFAESGHHQPVTSAIQTNLHCLLAQAVIELTASD